MVRLITLEIEPLTTLNTKWGVATLNDKNYFRISDRKSEYYGKYLHRLIFEDFYGAIPNDCIIHHKDKNSLNNCLINLQIKNRKNHMSLHMFNNDNWLGKEHSDETKIRISNSQSTTGYFRVHKHKDETCKQGFIWRYSWYENGKSHMITRVNIDDLEMEVKNRGLQWLRLDQENV